jgi:hypothetical protein
MAIVGINGTTAIVILMGATVSITILPRLLPPATTMLHTRTSTVP